MKKRNVIVIGAGFSGLSAAATLAQNGFEVTVLEKNQTAGGRARKFSANGFTFDMGPSWYWMPDIFEEYFASFGRKVSDYYQLDRLNPSYKIYFGPGDEVVLPASIEGIYALYESIEPGSSTALKKFLEESAYKYRIGIGEFVRKPSHSISEYLHWKIFAAGLKLNMLSSFGDYTRRYFRSEKINRMLEFPVLFLGGTAKSTPALYSLMNYSDMVQGTWYPRGGMYRVVEGMETLAREKGVSFVFDAEVRSISTEAGKVISVSTATRDFAADYVIAAADYHHVEQHLLPENARRYSQKYWDSRVLSPSSLIFYLGFNTRIQRLDHHTLLFDEDFAGHVTQSIKEPEWPEKPSVYISCTSKTDDTVAPEGHENVMVLIPVAPGLKDTEIREEYLDHVLMRMERYTGQSLREHLVYRRSYAHADFESDYHAFKGKCLRIGQHIDANRLPETKNQK
ncbi:MAG: phytoene desaturase family protein [Lentimicrobium sp.]|uniref:phytoene desaturase family protein n=1 Tax=Lentimicrobium sp. TaxID=2034841 RepID=UPI0025E062E3|nr:phytoene desaturase family protein [Lentimicrobium sp.]MCO5256496.1 phytoene desaturase family protein [Lentimicrobium sp.]